jgi:class 3 adenylate cyclase
MSFRLPALWRPVPFIHRSTPIRKLSKGHDPDNGGTKDDTVKTWARLALGSLLVAAETKYARSGDLHLAYQVVGNGPFDLLFLADWVNHIELQWEEPRQERFLEALASFSRLILFNPRGMGASDPIPISDVPTVEQWMDDARTVLDAVGSERPALFGAGIGGVICSVFAATYPERVRSLVLFNSTARSTQDPPDYPFGNPPEMIEMLRQLVEQSWGTPQNVATMLPVLAPDEASDPRLQAWLARMERMAASPGMAAAVQRMLFGIDIRQALPAIQAPTLVIHRAGVRLLTVEMGRYLGRHIPGATYKELPGAGYAYWAGDQQELLDEVEEFLTGSRSAGPPDRVLATVLFTDIVGSTATASEVGDRRWKSLIREHDEIVRRELGRHRGREVHTTGDGVLATFDGPARAIRCAVAIRDAVRDANLQIRAGLHTGEIELQGDDIAGIAVHIGARVSALAGPGEILVSRTVMDLVTGSGLEFEDRGSHVLKGVPGEWQLFSLVG